MNKKPKVLFLSRGNAARSQIAEGLLRKMAGGRLEAASAGTEPSTLNQLAVEVMAEEGVDISQQKSNSVKELFRERFAYVVTIFDGAKERSAVFPFATNLERWSLSDPSSAGGSPEQKKSVFRQVRDQIRGKLEDFLKRLAEKQREQEAKAAALQNSRGRAA
jgi:arsenate reductase (thioredoxin)